MLHQRLKYYYRIMFDILISHLCIIMFIKLEAVRDILTKAKRTQSLCQSVNETFND